MAVFGRYFKALRRHVARGKPGQQGPLVTRQQVSDPALPPTRVHAPSLRPHTMMIDLLFGALMLFAFQIGPTTQQPIVAHELELPTSDPSGGADPGSLLPLVPEKRASTWRYKLPDGSYVEPTQAASLAREQGKTLVLVLDRSTSLETYLDAEQPLRRQGLTVGLAVEQNRRKP